MQVGIDLGTTNTVISVIRDGKLETLKNINGKYLTPSVVAFDEKGTLVFGETAKALQSQGNPNAVGSFKVNMGASKQYEINGHKLTPKDLSALLLKYVKESAEKVTSETITSAVVTVPAYFTELQREETKQAAERAGLKVDRIINEPTAAALAYGVKLDEEQTVLIYDLGGGTFDVSILSVDNGVISVEGTRGNNRLGGDNFDEALANFLIRKIKSSVDEDFSEAPIFSQEMFEQVMIIMAKTIKEKLSSELEVTLDTEKLETIFGVLTDEEELMNPLNSQIPKINKEIKISRTDFTRVIAPYLIETVEITERALDSSGLSIADIDKIILVGGSTRIPAVQEYIKKTYEEKEITTSDLDPDLSISLGAAIQHSIVTGENKDIILSDITPMNLSIEVAGGMVSTIIKSGSTIPARKKRIFTTNEDNQTQIVFKVRQGNKIIANENELLGDFTLTGIRAMPKGKAKIEVTFRIDVNGILSVEALDIDTFRKAKIERKVN